MKLLVFAHTPPPHHGQSYMVKLMLEGFGGDWRKKSAGALRTTTDSQGTLDSAQTADLRVSEPQSATLGGIQCYHVNTRYSDDITDMGAVRIAKAFLAFLYCLEAVWCRFRYGVDTFYFAPAPPKRPALYRDWLVMLICRPFFHRVVHHWHAAGLGDWLQEEGSWFERAVTRQLLGKASLGVALAATNLRDPLWLQTRNVAVVPNGIPDPFADVAEEMLSRRTARREARKSLLRGATVSPQCRDVAGGEPEVFRILYLAYCFREKGLFDTLEGIARAQARLQKECHPLNVYLTVAGDFASSHDQAEFTARMKRPDLDGIVDYRGFVNGAEKIRLLKENDCLCFPTYYHLESFGLVVLEAMAAGLNVIATRWRALPEILPAEYPGFVPVRDPDAIAAAIPRLFAQDSTPLRTLFLKRFTATSHLQKMHDTLQSLAHGHP